MKRAFPWVLSGTLLCASGLASAGPFADDMAKCLVNSTSTEDRTVLIKWMFGMVTLHPDLTSMSTLTSQQREGLSKSAGALLQRLLLDSCRTQAQQAIQNEGAQTIQYAFQVLGGVAARGMMSDPQVLDGLKDVSKYVDAEQIKALATPSPARK
jgi:hypothetical protein